MTMSIGGTTGLTFPDSSTQNTAATGFGFKNRIINGAMMIDQRNDGALIPSAGNQYPVDRWVFYNSQSGKFAVGQNAAALTPPVGFTNYLGFVSSSAYSVLATDYFVVDQCIEGLNVSDLAWGTANAKTVTLSFQVYSSLTGTFGGAISNSAGNRSYPFTYTVSSASTWVTASVTIPGDTTGTWLTTNGIGMRVRFSLGVGSNYQGTANTWQASSANAPTGTVSVVGTNGAVFGITGVQLEKGSTATSFDYRPYGTELALCQRYLPALNINTGYSPVSPAWAYATSAAIAMVNLPVTTRVLPTGMVISSASHFGCWDINTGFKTASSLAYNSASLNTVNVLVTGMTGLTQGQGTGLITAATTAARMYFTGCEL